MINLPEFWKEIEINIAEIKLNLCDIRVRSKNNKT